MTTTADLDALRLAVDADPADGALRLVYADWLEEHAGVGAEGGAAPGGGGGRPGRARAGAGGEAVSEYLYTTAGEYRRTHPECTGDIEDVMGDVLDDAAEITVDQAGAYCVGHDTGNATWMPLE